MLIWKNFKSTVEWRFLFWNIFFRFEDINIFALCKLATWWCHQVDSLTHWLLELFAKSAFFWTFWWFLGWISAGLPLIRSKIHLQHNSLPFLPPASLFSALWLGHGIFFSPFLFLLFSCFCCSDWPSTGLACS